MGNAMAAERKCPSDQTLDDLMANRLSADRAESVRQHRASCPVCGPGVATQPPEAPFPFLEPPEGPGEIARLGHYRVLGVLGAGGMAIVFEAEDGRLHRKVALKVLRPEKCSGEMRERFLREARLLASLPHEHIVNVFEVGEANGLPYMAMERLEGTTLEERLNLDHSLPLDEALSIAIQVAEGLEAVHAKDLVHRDVKPANIWLETAREGRPRRVKLLDFGIARRTAGDDGRLTVSGQIIGTPSYMAPEQAVGLPVDRRADIYALGCVMYRMLTGKPPFEGAPGETMLLLEAVIKGDAPRIGAAAPHLPPGVARLIQRMLSKNVLDRPTSARDLVAHLRRLREQPGDTSILPGTDPARAEALKRRPDAVGIVLGGAAILTAMLIGAVALWYAFAPARQGVAPRGAPIKVGILHTHNGPLSLHEMPVHNATHFAIDELIGGKLLGRPVVTVDRDGTGSEDVFAEKARELIVDEKVDVLFGCWSAASRKRVEKVCEEHGKLLFFSAGYEGLEDSPAVVYLGGTPNQTLIPLVNWAFTDLRKRRFLLLGSEDIYSHAVNAVLKHKLDELGAVSSEHYQLVGDEDFGPVVAKVAKEKVDFIVNTVDGPGIANLLSALRRGGLKPPAVTTAWASLSESEVGQFKVEQLVGDYSAGTYFESIDRAENREFVRRYKGRFKAGRVSDAMETAYFGVMLWKKAVEKAKSTETASVRRALSGMEVDAPEGKVRLTDALPSAGLHAYRTARVGRITLDGSQPYFDIVYTTPRPIAPDPYPEWRTREQWQAFVDGLFKEWGGRWESHR